jgi:hypothetical protein
LRCYFQFDCRLEPEELEAMVQAVPKRHSILGKMDGRWEVRHWLLLLQGGA